MGRGSVSLSGGYIIGAGMAIGSVVEPPYTINAQILSAFCAYACGIDVGMVKAFHKPDSHEYGQLYSDSCSLLELLNLRMKFIRK